MTIALTDERSLTDFVLLPSDTEIKGDVLFLGYYESEFDWNNETAKVKLPQFGTAFFFFYIYQNSLENAYLDDCII